MDERESRAIPDPHVHALIFVLNMYCYNGGDVPRPFGGEATGGVP